MKLFTLNNVHRAYGRVAESWLAQILNVLLVGLTVVRFGCNMMVVFLTVVME